MEYGAGGGLCQGGYRRVAGQLCAGLSRWKRPARAMGMPGGALRLDPAVGQGSDLERAPTTHQGRLFKIEGDK